MHASGQYKGPILSELPSATVALVRADSFFSKRIEAFLHSACPVITVEQAQDILLPDFPDGPTVICLIGDAPDDGLWGRLSALRSERAHMPVILFLRRISVPEVVRAMRMGTQDVLVDPIRHHGVMSAINGALDRSEIDYREAVRRRSVDQRMKTLTVKQREVLDLLLLGYPNKRIAEHLGLKTKTVENHRGQLMQKMQARSIAELVRSVLEAQPAAPVALRAVNAPPPPPRPALGLRTDILRWPVLRNPWELPSE